MLARIDSLTPQQEARLGEWRDKWIAIGLKTGEADWATFEKAVKVAYKKTGLKEPKVIVRVQSPIVGAFAAPIASKIINDLQGVDGAVGGAVRGAVDGAVRGAVRDAVRGAVDGAVGDAVDGAVDGAVGDAVRGAVDGAVRDAVGDAVRDAVDGAVDGAVRDAVGDAVRDAVDGAVDGAVRDAVRGAVRDAVRDAVDGAVGSGWYNRFGGQFWVGGWWGSPAYVSFMTEVCGLETTIDIQERAKSYQETCESACWWWPYTNFVMVCNRPSKIMRNAEGALHSETGKAIEWPDGWGFHVLRGVRFDKDPDLWQKVVDKTITAEEVMQIQDVDKRTIAISMLKPDELLRQLKAKLIDTGSEGTKLYECKNFMGTRQVEYCMLMTDWSTPREFIEFIPPEIGKKEDAVFAQASAFGISKNEYLAIKDRG